jgi:hypothetical protein
VLSVAIQFDRDRLHAEFQETALRKQQSLEAAHDLLLDYVTIAQELEAPLWEVSPDSPGAKLAIIILKSWPVGPNEALQYYKLLTSSTYDNSITAAVGGLFVTPRNDFFLQGVRVPVAEAAAWLASVSGFDPDRVRNLLEDALRGNPGRV